jgi:hypothetical protein
MAAHPFALVLSSPDGWSTTSLATFREAADLWTFYGAWCAEVFEDTKREARFCYLGRGAHYTRPQDDRAAFLAWVESRKNR